MKGLVVNNKQLSISHDLNQPMPKKGEVLVKIKYASVHSFDLENIEGKNQLIAKLMGAKIYPVQTGIEFSGVVETDGHQFKKGDKVFGYPDLIKGAKAHQEYIVINEDLIAQMPSNLDFAESSAIPVGALTSLAALENIGKIRKGSKVLINGAAGGVGVYAVQIARIFDANITAIAGANQEDFLKELGADKVINYKKQKLTDDPTKYDIIFDLTTKVQFSSIKKMLKPNGIFIPADPFTHLSSMFGNFLRKRKVGYLLISKGNNQQLNRITKWIETGQMKPIIDKIYPFEKYEEAFNRTMASGKRGRILLKIA